MCILTNCKVNNSEFNGDAELMFEYLKSEGHARSYFHRIYGDELIQENYGYEELLKWTIQNEENRYIKENNVKTNSRDYQSVQNGNRPDSSYIRETIQRDKERKLPPRPLPPISKPLLQSEPESNNLSKINTSNEGQNENGGAIKTEQVVSFDAHRCNTKRKLSQSDADQRQDKVSRTTYSEENPLWTLPLSLQTEPKPDLSLVEHQLPSNPLDQNQTPINGNHNIEIGMPSTQVQDPVKKFNQDMAKWVMSCMNIYYQYESNRDSCIKKISDQNEYSEIAKTFSRDMRRKEKESYISINGTYDGLEMNLDMKDRVKMNIDMYFERKPLLPLD